MKTTQNKAVNAYIALLKLYRMTLKGKTARDLYMLKSKLEPSWNFQRDEQEKYLQACNGTADENGTLKFNSIEDRDKFDEKVNEIAEVEVELDITPVQIKCDDVEISGADIEALIGFVDFVD